MHIRDLELALCVLHRADSDWSLGRGSRETVILLRATSERDAGVSAVHVQSRNLDWTTPTFFSLCLFRPTRVSPSPTRARRNLWREHQKKSCSHRLLLLTMDSKFPIRPTKPSATAAHLHPSPAVSPPLSGTGSQSSKSSSEAIRQGRHSFLRLLPSPSLPLSHPHQRHTVNHVCFATHRYPVGLRQDRSP